MRTTRRSLLSQLAAAMAGVAFTSCHVRPAVGQVGRRREVIVNGKRVRTVDVHAHCHIPEATALAGYKETTPALIIGPERIRAMDEQGIDIEALSINPNFWDKAERDLQAQIVKVQNEKLVADGDCRADYRSALVGPAVLWPDEASAQFGPCGGDGMTNAAPSRTRRNGTVRCAIYTRKSSEEGLEQEFNSLQAQREACEAFTASQRHEGWVCLRAGYDDGGFSGATIERPAQRRLLADIAAGRVDTIVVYKIDRLTRSLADFAKIVEILDARGASFVSVTQQFNTTTSMGRLTLNILLSFAQFEREVIGERIRDKIAASKRKGMWMGGVPPLGYRAQDGKLVIVDSEAELVRSIFRRYAELGSVRC